MTARVVLLLSFAVACTTPVADTYEVRLKASRAYVRIAPIEDFAAKMADEMSQNIPEEKREEYTRLIRDEVDWVVIEAAMIESLARNLTLVEIETLTRFLSSPHGRSAMDKMPAYMKDLMPVIMTEIRRALAETDGRF